MRPCPTVLAVIPPAAPTQGLRQAVHLVVVSAVREPRYFQLEVLQPRCARRNQYVTGRDLGRLGGHPGNFVPVRPYAQGTDTALHAEVSDKADAGSRRLDQHCVGTMLAGLIWYPRIQPLDNPNARPPARSDSNRPSPPPSRANRIIAESVSGPVAEDRPSGDGICRFPADRRGLSKRHLGRPFAQRGRTSACAPQTCPVGRDGCYWLGHRHGSKGADRRSSIRLRISGRMSTQTIRLPESPYACSVFNLMEGIVGLEDLL